MKTAEQQLLDLGYTTVRMASNGTIFWFYPCGRLAGWVEQTTPSYWGAYKAVSTEPTWFSTQWSEANNALIEELLAPYPVDDSVET